jgi:hypothetical protein
LRRCRGSIIVGVSAVLGDGWFKYSGIATLEESMLLLKRQTILRMKHMRRIKTFPESRPFMGSGL